MNRKTIVTKEHLNRGCPICAHLLGLDHEEALSTNRLMVLDTDFTLPPVWTHSVGPDKTLPPTPAEETVVIANITGFELR